MEDIVVLLLAGGDSSRFWPLKDKHSLSFIGRPLPQYSLIQLQKFGFKNIIIVVNSNNIHLFEKLKSEFNDLSITLVRQIDPRGMAGAVVSAQKYILGKKLLIVSPSDVYEDVLLSDFQKIVKGESDGILAGTIVKSYFPGGYLTVSNGIITSLIEKPESSKTPSNIVTFVFDYFKNSKFLIEEIQKVRSTHDDNCYEQAINGLIKRGLIFKFLNYKGFWGYLKYPWHTLNLTFYFLHKLDGKNIKRTTISKSSTIIGDVFIDEGVKILENAKIVGPSYIGKGSIIGNNSIIRESIIGAHCMVGYNTEITRSYIGNNCWFHTNYIGDSIVSDNVSMGAGTILANFKLGEDTIKTTIMGQKFDTNKIKFGSVIGTNVRIGVNTSIMPGVKIGKNCVIGAAVYLDRDLPNGKFCIIKNIQYTIKNNKISITDTYRKSELSKIRLS